MSWIGKEKGWKNKMDGFTFFKSYGNAFKKLSIKDRGILITKIIDFMFEDVPPSFTEKEEKQELVWIGIEAILTKSKNKSRKNQK